MAAEGSVLSFPEKAAHSLSGAPPRFSLAWEDQEEDLRKLKRYGRMNPADGGVMFYRTDLLIHEKRVEADVREMLPLVMRRYPNFNSPLALLEAKYHDHPELRLGDIPLQLKLKMNVGERFLLERDEKAAARFMARRYPKWVGDRRSGRYKLLDLWYHWIDKDIPEVQLGSVVDKKDGFCEALHETLAGNLLFLEPVINYLTHTFNDLPGNFPLVKDIFVGDENPFAMPVCELYKFFQGGKWRPQPHTTESVARDTGIPMYESWKRLTIREFGVGVLINQVEFY